jgi:hypothetical protein
MREKIYLCIKNTRYLTIIRIYAPEESRKEEGKDFCKTIQDRVDSKYK